MKILILSLALTSSTLAVDPGWSDTQWANFLAALQQTETGGEPNNGIGAVGDNGTSYGPLQISKAAFIDAQEYDKTLKDNKWEDCKTDLLLSQRVAKAYIKRYAPKGADMATVARVYNGGPLGAQKHATLAYARKFVINLAGAMGYNVLEGK